MPNSGMWALATKQLLQEVQRLGTWPDFPCRTLACHPVTTLTLEKRMQYSGVIHSKPFLFWYPPIFQTVTLRLRKE